MFFSPYTLDSPRPIYASIRQYPYHIRIHVQLPQNHLKTKKKRGQVTISIVYTCTVELRYLERSYLEYNGYIKVICKSICTSICIWFLLNPLFDPYTLRSPRLTASTSSELGLFLLVRLEASYESFICFMHSLCVT